MPKSVELFKGTVPGFEPVEKFPQRMVAVAKNIVGIVECRIEVWLVPDVERNQCCIAGIPVRYLCEKTIRQNLDSRFVAAHSRPPAGRQICGPAKAQCQPVFRFVSRVWMQTLQPVWSPFRDKVDHGL